MAVLRNSDHEHCRGCCMHWTASHVRQSVLEAATSVAHVSDLYLLSAGPLTGLGLSSGAVREASMQPADSVPLWPTRAVATIRRVTPIRQRRPAA